MDIFTRSELEQLMRKEQQWCVSIYMPTHRTGSEAQQDPVRLKNLLGPIFEDDCRGDPAGTGKWRPGRDSQLLGASGARR